MTDEQKECDHEWKTHDDSFSHEFGTEIIVYDECEKCGLRREPIDPE